MSESRKPVLLVAGHKLLVEFEKAFKEKKEATAEKISELKTEARKLEDELDNFKMENWGEIKKYLLSRALLPQEFTDETHALIIKDGVLFIGEKNEEYISLKDKMLTELMRGILKD